MNFIESDSFYYFPNVLNLWKHKAYSILFYFIFQMNDAHVIKLLKKIKSNSSIKIRL